MNPHDGRGPGIELSPATLERLDPRVSVPGYDRAALRGGIVHIGVGGFHRAHQAVYLDDLCAQGVTHWSITGAGVLPADTGIADALGRQGGLYTLVARDVHGASVRVIGSLVDYVLATPSLDALVERLLRPETRIVSLTITEGGYPVDPVTGAWVPAAEGRIPVAFEAIGAALRSRRERGQAGFTVLSCDNVMHNGAVARAVMLGVAATMEPGLETWVERYVAFPNSMVDRITPATSDADRAFLRDEYGLIDRWPVVSETFSQWVIEDVFPYGRPSFDDAGALFTSDVGPYETLKLRLLNAGHSTLAYLAALRGIEFVHQVMQDPLFARFLQRFHDDEAGPSLPPVVGIDVEAYKATVRERFANPEVGDQVARICLDGSSKFPKFLIPTIESQLDRGDRIALGALALAGWCQYLIGTDDQGGVLKLAPDPLLESVCDQPRAPVETPAAFLRFGEVFGKRLPLDPVFVPAFVDALVSLRTVGTQATLKRWLPGAA